MVRHFHAMRLGPSFSGRAFSVNPFLRRDSMQARPGAAEFIRRCRILEHSPEISRKIRLISRSRCRRN